MNLRTKESTSRIVVKNIFLIYGIYFWLAIAHVLLVYVFPVITTAEPRLPIVYFVASVHSMSNAVKVNDLVSAGAVAILVHLCLGLYINIKFPDESPFVLWMRPIFILGIAFGFYMFDRRFTDDKEFSKRSIS